MEEEARQISAAGEGPIHLGGGSRDVEAAEARTIAIAMLGPNEVNRPLLWNDLNAAQRKFQPTKWLFMPPWWIG